MLSVTDLTLTVGESDDSFVRVLGKSEYLELGELLVDTYFPRVPPKPS